MSTIRYAKNNKVRFRSLKDRQDGIKIFNDFFNRIENEEGKEMKGHIILESTSNSQEAIVLTFWETKNDMDRFYSEQNGILAKLVERVKPLFEIMPERTDFAVSEFCMAQ